MQLRQTLQKPTWLPQVGIDQNSRAYGQFEATGVRPTFINRLEAKGVKLPSNMFAERVLMKD